MSYLVDAFDVSVNPKGISRVLVSVAPHLARLDANTLFVCRPTAVQQLARLVPGNRIVSARPMLQSAWEQVGLPAAARRASAAAVYSHREAGALWGAPLLLHVPEDPRVRWRREAVRGARDWARRRYSDALLRRSVTRAHVAVSTRAVAHDLADLLPTAADSIPLIPLGVDHELFRPVPAPTRTYLFHLGSSDARDRSELVVSACAAAQVGLPLVIAGAFDDSTRSRLTACASEAQVELTLAGRVPDEELRDLMANAAVVVQPSADEGFGLQPLEAMACGAPVVVTSTPAVDEVVGHGAAVITAAEPAAIALGVQEALDRSQALREASLDRASAFTWSRTAERILEELSVGSRR